MLVFRNEVSERGGGGGGCNCISGIFCGRGLNLLHLKQVQFVTIVNTPKDNIIKFYWVFLLVKSLYETNFVILFS